MIVLIINIYRNGRNIGVTETFTTWEGATSTSSHVIILRTINPTPPTRILLINCLLVFNRASVILISYTRKPSPHNIYNVRYF